MAILKTVLTGTHTNTQQIIAEFNTRVLNENPIAIVVQLNVQMLDKTIQKDFVMDSKKTTRTIVGQPVNF